jgi:hypothetical protein
MGGDAAQEGRARIVDGWGYAIGELHSPIPLAIANSLAGLRGSVGRRMAAIG